MIQQVAAALAMKKRLELSAWLRGHIPATLENAMGSFDRE